MPRKVILTVSLLLPLLIVAGGAYASHNYQHRPDLFPGGRPGGGGTMHSPVIEGRSAFAPRAPDAAGGPQPYIYLRAPKSAHGQAR